MPVSGASSAPSTSEPTPCPADDAADPRAEADDASDRDLGAALHEVSNGLTVILGWLEQARNLAQGQALEEALSVATARARRAHRVARRAIGADISRPAVEPLASLVAECALGLGPEAARKRISIVTKLAEPVRHVSVEAGERLLQILTNLVMNGLTATPPEGSVRIEVSSGREPGTVCFLVTDGGAGIAPADRARVFERGLTGRIGGAGIGLSHSMQVAIEEGGRLALSPFEPGKGAAFELAWPTAPITSRQGPRTVRAASLSGLRIAVVDDDPSIVELLDMVLSARGAHVRSFARHDDLELALAASVFDVALLDASPYGSTLGEALGRLRAAHPELDLILISGAMDPGGTVDRLGVTWIRKPFDVEEVIEVVRVVRAKTLAGT